MSGAGFPRKLPFGRHDTVDDHLEEPGDTGSLEDLAAVAARRHHRAPEAAFAGHLDEPYGSVVHLDAVAPQQLDDEVVLAGSEPVDGLRVRWVVHRALRDGDRPRREEGPHAVGRAACRRRT